MLSFVSYNIFVNYIFSGIAITLFLTLVMKFKRDKEALSFAFFWLFFGLGFIGEGTRLLVYRYGYVLESIFLGKLEYVVGAFCFAAAVYHAIYKIFRNEKASKIFSYILIGVVLLFIYTVLKDGMQINPNISQWGPNLQFSQRPWLMFLSLFSITFILFFYDFCRRIFTWIKQGKVSDSFRFFATLSVLISGVAEVFDSAGISNWIYLLVKLIILFGSVVAFLAYTSDSAIADYERNFKKIKQLDY